MEREYPKVWRRFERNLQDVTVKFEIEDIPEAMWSTAVEFMLGNYIREDVWWATAGTAQDPEAVQEYRVLLTSVIQQKHSLACFLSGGDGSGTLVAVHMCLPQKKGCFVEHSPPKTEAGLLSLRMFSEAMKVTAIYDKYGVEEYLMGSGLSVAPEFRKLGIATELLKARVALAQAAGFKATGGIFTSALSQRAAERAGFECLYETPYGKFGAQCNIKFVTETEFLKIYGVKTE